MGSSDGEAWSAVAHGTEQPQESVSEICTGVNGSDGISCMKDRSVSLGREKLKEKQNG